VRDLTIADLRPVLGSSTLNLIRRGADGSLRMSVDRWRLAEVEPEAVVFRSIPAEPPAAEQVLEVLLVEVERITWDRLPRQQARSQLRFHLRSGDLWTFSGALAEPADD
jgi:hypothetical protein